MIRRCRECGGEIQQAPGRGGYVWLHLNGTRVPHPAIPASPR
jgi:hypothetical protein